MNIEISPVQDQQCTITLYNKFTFINVTTVREITDVVTANSLKLLTLDFKHLSFMDSTALGVLLVVNEHMKTNGGVLKIVNAQGQVARLFGIVDLDKLLKS